MSPKNSGETKRDRVRNDRIREELHIKAVETTIDERILSWYGHLLRMDENRKPRQYMEARAQGRRPIGRPRVTWEANCFTDSSRKRQDRESVEENGYGQRAVEKTDPRRPPNAVKTAHWDR
ncbi:uncharacterized protein LOC120356521 [Nilaparvata lugens]|uniref:uncharacterized protein LOC120356521 n=1 Tax=Nilaparvata lugens TaxID=108931 RepID=UPI00193E2E75|nr:uncharacterized protein LOC120356521 [Nilaparvata lugens]